MPFGDRGSWGTSVKSTGLHGNNGRRGVLRLDNTAVDCLGIANVCRYPRFGLQSRNDSDHLSILLSTSNALAPGNCRFFRVVIEAGSTSK